MNKKKMQMPTLQTSFSISFPILASRYIYIDAYTNAQVEKQSANYKSNAHIIIHSIVSLL